MTFYQGEEGARNVLTILRNELKLAMQLSGKTKLFFKYFRNGLLFLKLNLVFSLAYFRRININMSYTICESVKKFCCHWDSNPITSGML